VGAVEVRWTQDSDLVQVAAVARATGSAGECAGDDPRYLAHVRARGGLAVAVVADDVVGYGGVSRTHGGLALTDLFVLESHRSHGVGSALLDLLWDEPAPRLTFASAAPPAAAVYARRGLKMLWPLLYLVGSPARLPDTGLSVEQVDAATAGEWDSRWQGLDVASARNQVADYRFWDGRPHGAAFVVRDGVDVVAAGCLGGLDDSYGLAHLSAVSTEFSAAAVLAALRAARSPTGPCLVCVPGPHPVVQPLLDAGFRLTDHDLHMATDGVRIDPTRHVLHPGLV
jgi:GNAT superfamily N-acetyltransferase